MKWVVDELVEDALRELADEDVQTTLWRSSTGPEVSSLVECTCRLWDDSGLTTAMDHGDVYTPAIDEHLRELRTVLHRLEGTISVDALLASCDLTEARTLARMLLKELREFGSERS